PQVGFSGFNGSGSGKHGPVVEDARSQGGGACLHRQAQTRIRRALGVLTIIGEAPMSDKPIAIVTGVGPGTGSAIVRRLAAEGFRVIAMARSPDRIRALEAELTDTHAMICDVSSESEVRDAIETST